MIASGTVTNTIGQVVPGANVYVSDSIGTVIGTGTKTDDYGNYFLDAGAYEYITASHVSYNSQTKNIASVLDFELTPRVNEIPDVVVIADKFNPSKLVFFGAIGALLYGLFKK